MKKGLMSFNILITIVRLIFVMIAMAIVVFMIMHYVVVSIDVFDLESNLFAQRMIYSQNSISYKDSETGRLYPGTIDLNNFNQGTLNGLLNRYIYYGEGSNYAAAKLDLSYLNDTLIRSAYYDEEWFNNWVERARVGWTGIGQVKSKVNEVYVLIKDGDKMIPGKLKIEVLMPNA